MTRAEFDEARAAGLSTVSRWAGGVLLDWIALPKIVPNDPMADVNFHGRGVHMTLRLRGSIRAALARRCADLGVSRAQVLCQARAAHPGMADADALTLFLDIR